MQSPSDDPDRTESLVTRLQDAPIAADGNLSPGARLGRYRVEALLGRGGMGEVYRASQLEPVRREVALKLLRSQQLHARHRAWFEVERQLLAQMHHPAIAQIYDAGTTEDGYPFFVMELIAGSPVTAYCDQRQLSLRQRIELFMRICEGVRHAHGKGVIHRDLKPGNLLVDTIDGQALPKIIDFGIAVALSLSDGTVAFERAGTPEYMSPEQAREGSVGVDICSDVYSLGVVLGELLAGVRPEPATDEKHTPRLGERLAALPAAEQAELATRRGLSATELRRRLRDDLDWIVDKATRAEPAARYATVAALSDDLQRHLQGRPVQAVPASRAYVWRKFVGRHRLAAAVTTIVTLALLGGLAVSLYGLRQANEQRALAEMRRDELEKVASFQQSMLEGIDIETMGVGLAESLQAQVAQVAPADAKTFAALLADTSPADTARELVDRQLLANAEAAIGRDFGDQPDVAAALRESLGRVYKAIGLYDKAAGQQALAAEYRSRTLGEAAPSTLQARQAQVEALLEAAHVDAAEAVLQQALPHARTLPENDRVRVQLELAEAQTVSARGDRARARTMVEAILQRLQSTVGENDPTTLLAMNNLAAIQRNLGELDAARRNMETVVRLRTRLLGAQHEETLSAMGNLAVLRIMAGEKREAVALQQQLVDIYKEKLGDEHPVTLQARATLSTMLIDSGEAEAALPAIEAVLEARERVLGYDHPQTIRTRLNLATAHARLHDFKTALRLEDQVIEARTRLLGPTHPDTLSILVNHAATLFNDGQAEASLNLLTDLQPLAMKVLGPRHPQAQAALFIRSEALMEQGRYRQAVTVYRELLDVRRSVLGETHHETRNAAWNLIDAYRTVGQDAEADALYRRYVAPLLAADPDTLSEPDRDFVDNYRRQARPGKR
ncbi:hypothetical protein CSC70_13095 [Pseudoxanthomonas kalamensis DSM 18571]|uniref:serine/threonine-protein kinase n=1 Tax=Pseudoxanthomonas kalamensis TaxID=289483 RepID=UPI0013913B00|nr:serine/threonine-protein kinase [Pseudoxanthomonas kalamensis]KAF1708574.1 hypothetical protein CSC70_13095 [Pseudoxanthomonas kalamensis DSM 18571]